MSGVYRWVGISMCKAYIDGWGSHVSGVWMGGDVYVPGGYRWVGMLCIRHVPGMYIDGWGSHVSGIYRSVGISYVRRIDGSGYHVSGIYRWVSGLYRWVGMPCMEMQCVKAYINE